MKTIKKYCNSEIFHKAKSCGFSKIIATVSGGPDSIALLSMLKDRPEFETIALHCNFHLRAEESMRDQHLVEKICGDLGIDLRVKDFDVYTYVSSNKGISIEMACRELRYEWFREMKSLLNADRIATGHNADDNVETMFLNLLRGSGTSGLKGMSKDNGEIWRPLLGLHRKEIMKYLESRGLPFVIDSSNLASDYRRNFLRNEIIPLLRSRWEGLDKALDRSIRLINEDNRIVVDAIGGILEKNNGFLDTKTILSFPSPISLIRRFIEPACPFTTTADEIIAAIKADKPHARIWKLKKGSVELRNKKLRISK